MKIQSEKNIVLLNINSQAHELVYLSSSLVGIYYFLRNLVIVLLN